MMLLTPTQALALEALADDCGQDDCDSGQPWDLTAVYCSGCAEKWIDAVGEREAVSFAQTVRAEIAARA